MVCCGGGGLLAGVAAAIKLSGSAARVVGVEPAGAPSMVLSRQAGHAAWCPAGGSTSTIAHGLAPPFAGRACFNHVQQFVDDVVTVTDEEMRDATRLLYRAGLVRWLPVPTQAESNVALHLSASCHGARPATQLSHARSGQRSVSRQDAGPSWVIGF